MLNLKHKKLEVWNESISLVSDTYRLLSKFPKTEIYGVTAQMKRAVVSVSSNIAEGSSRISKKERKRFFEIARSSLVELDTQMVISINLEFMDEEQAKPFDNKMNKLFAKLSNLIAKT